MIAEPNSVVNLPGHKENGIHDETVPESTAQNGSCLRISSVKTLRGKRKTREQCENRRRNSSCSRRSTQPHNGEVVEAVTLFEVVSMGRTAMQSVVNDWVETYKKDRDVAILDLINFFIQCSGCQGMVTAEMFQSSQSSDVMQKMTETFDEETGLQYKRFMAYPWILTVTWPVDMENEYYPLIKPGPYWKKFKANFCEFTAVLIQQTQHSILYDNYLMDTIISLLTGLADSMVRAFRHTNTLAAMKLLTMLVHLAANLDVSKRNLERLYEVENRTTDKRTNRLEQLERKRKEYEQKPLEIQNMMNAIFKGTFLQRYRDVVPEIRAICIEEMGNWMKIHPKTFLNDSYLKYIGWLLYDKQPEVRLKCLHGLQGIYSQKELASKMDLFNCRFKDRIVSMTLDKDHEVAVQAMKLLMLMSQNCDPALLSEDCETLYHFVYTTHRALAVAAGELLYKRLIAQGIEVEASSKGNGKLEPIANQLRTLIIFYLEGKLHSHVTYLVDSLWDCAMILLKDWECMTNLLLENAHQGEALSDSQRNVLIEIILATVREAAEGHPPMGRGGIRKILSTREKKVHVEDCIKLTEHFIVVLPRLLAKYSGDAEKVTNLLQIPQYFNLDLYGTSHLEKHLDALLREVNTIVTKHSHADVLEASSRMYSVLCNEELAIYGKVTLARAELVDALVGKLNQLLGIFWDEREGFCPEDEVTHQISSLLRRITAFYKLSPLTDLVLSLYKYILLQSVVNHFRICAHDLTPWNLFDKMSQLLIFEVEHNPLPVQILSLTLQCAYFALLWQLHSVENGSSSKENQMVLKTHLKRYCYISTCYLSHKNKELREKAFMILCDLLMILNHQESSNNRGSSLLEYLPSTSLQSKMLLFIQDHVFTEEEGIKELTEVKENKKDHPKLDALHMKRCLLAAYCKLIIYNVVEMSAAAEIYKHYVKAHNDFGDIIKETLNRTRHNDKIQSAKTLILCLQQLFLKYAATQDDSSSHLSSATFSSIKELARRFSLTLGMDQVKSRELVAMIHKEGIEFAFQGAAGMEAKCLPPNLNFLIILSEFSNKLLKSDKRLVYNYLLRYMHEPELGKEDSWNSVVWYRSSLQADEDCSAVSSLNDWSSMRIAKTPSIKRKLSEGSLCKTSPFETENKTSDYSWPSPSFAMRSEKRLKSHDSYCQESPPVLGSANLKRKRSCDESNVEKTVEMPPENTAVDVVEADQEF